MVITLGNPIPLTSVCVGAAYPSGITLASHSAAPGSILGVPKSFSLDIAEIH